MNEEKATQRDSQAEPQAKPPMVSARPSASVPSQDAGWAGASTWQVARTVAVALLTAAVVLGALFLLWQVRTFVGWFVIALFLAAVLNPAVDWLQRRHRLIKRPIAIGLTYLGVVVALLFVVGIFLPLLVDQINGLTKFVAAAAQAPEGPTEYIKSIAKQNGLGGLFERSSDQLAALRKQLGELLGNVFSSTGAIAVGVAGFLAALASVLTLTFFLLLGQRAVRERGGGALPRGAPAPRAAHHGAIGGGDKRVRHGQPRHQRDLRRDYLRRASGPRHALRRTAGPSGRSARPGTAGRGDAGRGAARCRGAVRRALDGRCAARLRAGLPAGREQLPPAHRLQQSGPAQRAGDPDRAAGGRATARHPRRAAGHPRGGDHQDSCYRTAGLPANEPRGEKAHYPIARHTWPR